jgi:hypothetical protein
VIAQRARAPSASVLYCTDRARPYAVLSLLWLLNYMRWC